MRMMAVFRAALLLRSVACLSSSLPRASVPRELRSIMLNGLQGRARRLLASATETKEDPVAIVLPNNDDNEGLLRIRHSTAHVMAMAVQKLFKNTKVSIGPWIENGYGHGCSKLGCVEGLAWLLKRQHARE